MGAGKVHILSLDAMPYAMVERFKHEWGLKNFLRLEAGGAFAQGMIAPGPDITTPPAHAALVCGCGALEHGIYSFEEPALENGALHPWKKRSGFSSRRLKAEPLWISFLKAGKKVSLVHFPLSIPLEPYLSEAKFGADFSDRLTVIESFDQRLSFETVRKDIGTDSTFKFSLADKTKLELPARAPMKTEMTILPDHRAGLARMRFPPDAQSEPDYYFIAAVHRIWSNRPEVAQAYLDAAGPFLGGGGSYSYWHDKLGLKIVKGGTGKAEARVAQSFELVGEHFQKGIRFALEKVEHDIGFYYFHGVDLVLHLWMGLLDPESPASSPELRELLWPIVRRAFEHADRIVGLLLEASGPEDLVAVVSDHGMAPIESTFFPNQVLLEADLLRWDTKKNEPVLSESRAVYHRSNCGYIIIVTRSRGGPVEDGEAPELAKKIEALFGKYLGAALAKVELVSEHPELPGLGEIFLTPVYKTGLSQRLEGKILEPGKYGGQHHFWPERETMQAILYLKGPGVPAGLRLGQRSHLEFARTVAHLAGVAAPRDARFGPIKF